MKSKLTIYNHKAGRRIVAKTNLDIFEKMVRIKITENSIEFSKPKKDYKGKTYQMSDQGYGWHGTTLACNLPIGKYETEVYRNKLIFKLWN